MQIHLKQREIEAALKMFVSQQGINLTNKVIEVSFTAGRKDTGLSAELTIEDAVANGTNTFAEAVKEGTTYSPQEIEEAVAIVEPPSDSLPVKAASLFS